MSKTAVLQKIAKQSDDSFYLANTYFSIIALLNNLRITKREIQLLGYICLRGISSVNSRNGFCTMYNTTPQTINNMVSRLTAEGLLVKKEGKVKVIDQLTLDFNKDTILQISLLHAL